MASSSVNINLSAKNDLKLSISVLLPWGQVVEVNTGGSNTIPIPVGCNEILVLNEMSEATKRSESLENDLVLVDSEPVQGASLSCLESDSDKKVEGPLNEEMFLSVASRSPSPRCSPSSPSFSEINPNDLFWIPLPEIEFDDSIIDFVIENDGEMVAEIISCESFENDDDVVFLKEVKRSGTSTENK